MGALFLGLVLLSLPAQATAPAQEAATGLKCEVDAKNPKDPYGKMKKMNEDKIAAGIKSMGISVGRLPRQDMMASLNARLEKLCGTKSQVERIAASITTKKNEAANMAAGQEGCETYTRINDQLSAFLRADAAYQSEIEKAYKGEIKRYKKLVDEDANVLQAHMQKPAVAKSFREAWGRAPSEKVEPKDWPQFILTAPLAQMVKEHKLNDSRKSGYDELSKSILSLKEKCPSLAQIELMRASVTNTNTNTDTDTDTNTNTNTNTDTNTRTGAPIVGADGSPSASQTPPGQQTSTAEEEGWISRNKGTLIVGAGAAAAVGGLLWYKNKQDKEEKKDNRMAEWLASQEDSATATSTATATATSTGTGTSTDPDANTLTVTGFPPSAAVNHVISKITVTITGPDKNNAQVSIACVNSCSLAGTLTKTAMGGTAEFTDLYFTAPHQGVQLRFSAPGMNSVASPGSFNVVEAGRQ